MLNAGSRNAGFSIIELLVALGAMAVVIVMALGAFTYQHQTYLVVEQVSEAQQNSRAIVSLVERDLRNAGYMVSPEAAVCGVDNTGSADLLFVSDADAILPVDDLPSTMAGTDLGSSVSSTVGSVNAANQITFTLDDVVIDDDASYDVDDNGSRDSDFQVGGGAILVDLANPGQGVACGIVDAVTPTTSVQVTFKSGLSNVSPNPSDFRLIPAHFYQVITGVGVPNHLERDGEILAKDVEDFQLAWFYDDDGNGQSGGNEVRGVVGTAYDTTLVDGNDLREVRVNLVMSTRADDPRSDVAGTGQILENRTQGSVNGDDGRRRRVSTSTVRIRNLSL
ncbi:MAG: PilW family protein [Myxococcota bacterium]